MLIVAAIAVALIVAVVLIYVSADR